MSKLSSAFNVLFSEGIPGDPQPRVVPKQKKAHEAISEAKSFANLSLIHVYTYKLKIYN